MGTSDYLAGNIEAAIAGSEQPGSRDRIVAKVRQAISDLQSNPQAYSLEHPATHGSFNRAAEQARLETALSKLSMAGR